MAYNSYSSSGKSTSQNSIYDYPEHLNPFYEDDNHKRLRFWKFGSGRAKPKSERRNSFSFGGMWEFKTFRLRKKCSTLGINKTSESPPPLRREIDYNSNYNTIGPSAGYRNTVTLGTNNNFERNSVYRSSLQDQSRENGLEFQRNNRYRSTIQNGYATYGGSVTPTPKSRYGTNQGMTPGSSELSLKSSNPFEDDNCSVTSITGTNCSQTSKRPIRKKRRAPPPPVIVPKIIETGEDDTLKTTLKITESEDTTTTSASTALKSSPEPEHELEPSPDIRDLSSLTAEIESFVRISNTDECDTDSQRKVSNRKETEEKIELKISEEQEKTKTIPAEIIIVANKEAENLEVEEKKIEASSITPISRECEFVLESLALPATPVPAKRHTKHRPSSLTIRESCDSSSPLHSDPEDENLNFDSKVVKTKNYEFKVKLVPLKDEPLVIKEVPAVIRETTIVQNGSAGTERRRSVKDIIESINKSQSLLKMNQETNSKSQFTDNINKNVRELTESEKEIKRLIDEMDYTSRSTTNKRVSAYDNVPDLNDNLDNFDESNNLFEKCVLRSKKSPTKSLGIGDENDKFKDCIDWNPVPKPRRSRNFTTEGGHNDNNNNIDTKT